MAGRLVVAVVAIHNQGSRQTPVAENFIDHFGRTGGSEAKEADEVGAEEPRIAAAAIGAPAGLVGMFGKRLPVFLDQCRNHRLEPPGQAMESGYQRTVTDPELFLQLPQSEAVEVMLRGYNAQQPMGEQPFGRDARSGGAEDMPTFRAPLDIQKQELLLTLQGLGVDDGATLYASVL